jgi:hypothetical protein
VHIQESTLYLALRLRGGGTPIEVMYNGNLQRIFLRGDEMISVVKQKLYMIFSVPVERQILSCEGEELNDGMFSFF